MMRVLPFSVETAFPEGAYESGGSQVHALWDCHKQQVQSGEVRTLGCARKQIEFQVRMF